MSTEPRSPPSDQARALGRAFKALRDRAGMSQQSVADAMGVTRQAVQNYEGGARAIILRTDVQDQLAATIGLTRADLIRERDRQAGFVAGERPFGEPGDNNDPPYELPVLTRTEAGPEGPLLFGVAEPDTVVDMAWMFAPATRTLRMAGDRMSGYVESGQLVIYDTQVWPKRGEGCVIELKSGEIHVAEYVASGQGVIRARVLSPPEDLSYPLPDVAGVYAIRLRGA